MCGVVSYAAATTTAAVVVWQVKFGTFSGLTGSYEFLIDVFTIVLQHTGSLAHTEHPTPSRNGKSKFTCKQTANDVISFQRVHAFLNTLTHTYSNEYIIVYNKHSGAYSGLYGVRTYVAPKMFQQICLPRTISCAVEMCYQRLRIHNHSFLSCLESHAHKHPFRSSFWANVFYISNSRSRQLGS